MIAFFGSVKIRIRASLSRLSSPTATGKRPTNSGIKPYLSRSSGISLVKTDSSGSVGATFDLKPMVLLLPRRCSTIFSRSEEHTSELQSHSDLVCRLLLEKKKNRNSDRRALSSARVHHAARSRPLV